MNPVVFITILPFIVSLAVVCVLTPLTIFLFKKMGWVVDPKKSPHPAHIHKVPVPKGGGLPILIGVVVSLLFLLEVDKYIGAIIVASILTVAVGVADDIKSINPYFRLLVNFLSAFIVVAAGIGITFVTNPFGSGVIDLPWIFADLFALLWIPALMNAINWSSGVDGQISGVVTIAAVFLGAVSLTYSADITQWPVSTLAFSLAGAFAGFTVFHFFPQKIMPGYSATSFAGLMLGVISILATGKVGTAILVLAVPLIDFGYITVRRILTGNSPVWGDKQHLHHKLIQMGWGKRRVAVFYWLVTAIMGTVALNFEARIKLLIMIGLVLLAGIFLIWQYYGRFLKR